MKVIDLLNKIAKGEEVPKILHNGKYGIFDKERRAVAFYNDGKCTSYYGSWFNCPFCKDELNDEIETIEEPNKIEKIDKEKMYLDDRFGYAINIEYIGNKIDEIIDYINKENKDE